MARVSQIGSGLSRENGSSAILHHTGEKLFATARVAELFDEWLVPQLADQWIEAERLRSLDESEDNG